MKLIARQCISLVVLAFTLQPAAAKTLDIYFIDVEGGQATLLVTPAGETLLIDTGFPGDGRFESKPGDARQARDANRILAAARDAGVKQIDYLLITHFHGDHVGGAAELAQLLPIRTFVDHGDVPPEAEQGVAGTLEVFKNYAAVRAKGNHLNPKPGDRLPLKGVEAVVVSAAAATLTKPLVGAGSRNPVCGATGLAAQDAIENPRSTGVVIQFGKFRFLDVGDLSGAPLFALSCPEDLIGPVDVYLVTHHGGADAAEPATFAAIKPRVSLVNNGARKGGALALLSFLQQSKNAGDVWQLHRSEAAGTANFAESRIANLDDTAAHWIKLSANEDGSFRVFNARTKVWTDYGSRK